jgi:hypothetical protein
MSHNIDLVALGNLILSLITSLCALYIAYAALTHSTRPNVKVVMLNANSQNCSTTSQFVFQFTNVGHWYAKPSAINVVAFCNFPPEFELLELRYGATQQISNKEVRVGVGKMKYLKAKGLKLSYGDEGEEVHVTAKIPEQEGEYLVKISAYAEGGMSLREEFRVRCSRKCDDVKSLKS